MRMTKESHRMIREVLEISSLERIKSWLDTALILGHLAWVRDWTRCSLEDLSNLIHSVIVGTIKELNILPSLWSFSHFSTLHEMFQSRFPLKVLNSPGFCFLKGNLYMSHNQNYILKVTCFSTPAAQNTKSSSRKEATDQTYSLANKIFRQNNYLYILKSQYSAHYVRKSS